MNSELCDLQNPFSLRVYDSINQKIVLGEERKRPNPCSNPNFTSLIAGLPTVADLTFLSSICFLIINDKGIYYGSYKG